MIVSFSSISLDTIKNKLYLGGPSNYGGSVLDILNYHFNIDFLNVLNISKKDLPKINTLNHINLIPNYIPRSVNFNLIFKKNIRTVISTTPLFEISSNIFDDFNLSDYIKNNFVIISPIINEFNYSFYKKLFSLNPKFVFLDLYNNDDGLFSNKEIKLLHYILSLNQNVLLKLSENEYAGLKNRLNITMINKNIFFLITKGENGAEIILNGKVLFSVKGIKTKLVNATGAGDIFLYSFVGLYYKYNNFNLALKLANKIAACSITYNTPLYKKLKLNDLIKKQF